MTRAKVLTKERRRALFVKLRAGGCTISDAAALLCIDIKAAYLLQRTHGEEIETERGIMDLKKAMR